MARVFEAGCNDGGLAAAPMAADMAAERPGSGQNRHEGANSRRIRRAQPLASRGFGR